MNFNSWDEFPENQVVSFAKDSVKHFWTSQDCANYLGYNRQYFLQRIATKRDFPAEVPCSTRRNKKWLGRKVMEYATGEKL